LVEPIVYVVWLLAVLGGALGGVAVSFTQPSREGSLKNLLTIGREAFIGATAALALLALGSLGSLFDGTGVAQVVPPATTPPATLSSQAALLVLGGSVLAGFVGRRFLDAMSKTLLRNVEERVEEIAKENETMKDMLRDNTTMDNVRGTVLEQGSTNEEIKIAVSKLKGINERKPGQRASAILLGHALKRLEDYEGAVKVMGRFAQYVAQEPDLPLDEVARNQGDAYFNTACYQALAAAKTQDPAKLDVLLDDAMQSLRLAFVLNPSNLAEAITDEDLAMLREKRPDFLVTAQSRAPTS